MARLFADDANTMTPQPFVLDFHDDGHVRHIKSRIEADYPFLRISRVDVQGETVLKTDHGGQRFFCIFQGQGEVFVPAGYRGLNVFAMIMTIPGFKPGNELYLDRDVYEQTKGRAPYNENLINSKNYESLEEFLPGLRTSLE